jgi:hypothetical protein
MIIDNINVNNITMQTNEETLDQITALVNNYCNNDPFSPRTYLKQIQTILEEHYINGSIYNDYK